MQKTKTKTKAKTISIERWFDDLIARLSVVKDDPFPDGFFDAWFDAHAAVLIKTHDQRLASRAAGIWATVASYAIANGRGPALQLATYDQRETTAASQAALAELLREVGWDEGAK
jgi:hypothetical protein